MPSQSKKGVPIGETITLIDDNAAYFKLIEEALRSADLTLHLVHLDRAALPNYLEELQRSLPSQTNAVPICFLVSLRPHEDELIGVLERVKADPFLKSIPVVAMINKGAREFIEQSVVPYIDKIIEKPLSFDGWVEALRHLTRSLDYKAF